MIDYNARSIEEIDYDMELAEWGLNVAKGQYNQVAIDYWEERIATLESEYIEAGYAGN